MNKNSWETPSREYWDRWDHNSSSRLKGGGCCSSAATPLEIHFLYKQEKCLHAAKRDSTNATQPGLQKMLFPGLPEFQRRISSFSSCFPGWFLVGHCCSCWSCVTGADIPSPSVNTSCSMNINWLLFFNH